MNQLKISTRLTLGFAIMAAMIVLLGLVAFVQTRTISDEFAMEMQDRAPKVAAINDIALANAGNARALRDLVLLEGESALKPPLAELAANAALINDRFKRLEDTVKLPDGKRLLANVTAARAAYIVPRDKLRQLALAGDRAGATSVLTNELNPAQQRYQQTLEAFGDFERQLMKDSATAVETTMAHTLNAILGLEVLGLVLATLLGLWITRSTTRPLVQAVGVARAVAEGELGQVIDVRGRNETAQLMQALDAMQTRLAAVVGGVRMSAESVVTASAEIAQGNNDLSSRTEQQASALEETAASMEELSSTVKQNADSARQANQLAQSASAVAERGGEVVGQVVETMRGINDSSRKIADIISVIDGIAFQTNILALNAAVEAARAGEQGRGFAVVASEVRNLAQRSAGAAKEIKALIDHSVVQVDQGTALVATAGTTMTDVVNSIRRVTDIIAEVSAASGEQASGVAQVGEAITQMDQVTQQNAALVEESAAAADSLSTQAQQLLQSVAVFKLAGGASAVTDTRPRPVERRGPHRAKNVVRPAFGASKAAVKPASPTPLVSAQATGAATPTATATGTDNWTSF